VIALHLLTLLQLGPGLLHHTGGSVREAFSKDFILSPNSPMVALPRAFWGLKAAAGVRVKDDP